MKNLALTLAFVCLGGSLLLHAQTLDLNKKQLKAQRISSEIKLDGVLDDENWMDVPYATDFTTLQPNPGQDPSQKTQVKILYDDEALYIGAVMYDSKPDSILQELSQRDQLGNTDWFGVFLDPYRDGINGVSFIVTPAGVQFDAKYSDFGEDENWDAVWVSQTTINSQGWVAELKIPYSAIRFPKTQMQTWHLNFGRLLRREQQKSFWSEIDPQKQGFLNQSGYLMGIKDVKSPLRLQATPFIAVYGEKYSEKNAEGGKTNSFGRSFNGGMDIKYGINDAFTLDMTLIPDFGEAQSDNQVLNLSPFEVRFDENRQFFTEGTELFNKGGLFYSRRVGGRPLRAGEVNDQIAEGEEIIENPSNTQLVNATKISGRTKNGLGIGLFNAVSGRTFATIRNADGQERRVETDPLTNYNVFVLDQNLKHNSYVTFINTNVFRSGGAYDANVTGTVFSLRNKDNSYVINGSAKLSQKYAAEDTDLGYAYNLEVAKTSGNLRIGVEYNVESDNYDINDLGFIFNNNERSIRSFINYNFFKPFLFFNRGETGAFIGYQRLFRPDTYTGFGTEFWFWGETKSFWNVNVWGGVEPFVTYDYFEPRTKGRFFRQPTNRGVGFWVGSDSRKKLRVSFNGNFRSFSEKGRSLWNLSVSPRYRFNDKLSMSLSTFSSNEYNDVGFVNKISEEVVENGQPKSNDQIIFGLRDQTTVENVYNASFNFNNAMALTFRMRHYWTKVKYNRFAVLQNDGHLGSTDYTDNHNTSFNAFNIDMVYRWRFAPGSDIFLIWKSAIFGAREDADISYVENVRDLFDNPQSNSVSLKIIYFLDYVNVFKSR
jgi:hypothetical protein